ncbi:zinc-binding dehydrogenase family oxidoreductase [Achaetomium macrosporum]|uniref:Zinc-binding dehydrogenase family oxidoreductase n=1 Tax=Achaetomium macrosporum TaxID=79813 RepID=A0AAN7C5I7_9PEZI|nr:zinc-binding dehydrogenase family oxidoreductase [Achaetomium macrosporum]
MWKGTSSGRVKSPDPASPLPTTQHAIVQDSMGKPRLVTEAGVPALLPGTALVKTEAVALNPSDHKMGAYFPAPGAVVGMDFAGIVIAIHPTNPANPRNIAVGDRVCGIVHGSNPGRKEDGAFADYVRARPELLLRVPAGMSLEHAATLCTGLSTNLLALWEPEGLALAATPDTPAATPFPVLVYGASTATGTLAVQLLRLSGLEPIATCSPRNFDMVRGFGAAQCFDYTRVGVADEIKKATGGRLRHAYDCITDADSVAICYGALSRAGGRYVCLEKCPEELRTRRAVKHEFILGYDVFGEEVPLSGGYERPGDKSKYARAVEWFGVFQRLLDEGRLRTHPVQVLNGTGLDGVLKGLEMLKTGSVSGKKLVVRV